MTLLPEIEITLFRIASAMEMARDPWWIIGSTAVLLHGARPISVADVDVLPSVADARRILPAIGIAPEHKPAHSQFRSEIFATWTEPPLPVEFMADFHYLRSGQWRAALPTTRQSIAVGSVTVYVPERWELRDMMLGFGREKDFERVRLLDALA